MGKTVLYIATSLDGFIARPDGKIDWLTSVPYPSSGDYGYTALLESIGTLVMGRKTYEELIGFGIEWPYSGLDTYVVTRNEQLKIHSPDTRIVTGPLKTFLSGLKQKSVKDIWLVGGGELVTACINDDLLDKMIISMIPKTIGEGIPLFAGKPKETGWKLTGVEPFETSVVNLTWERPDDLNRNEIQ